MAKKAEIELSLKDNVSNVVPTLNNSLGSITDQIKDLTNSLNTTDLVDSFKRLNEQINNLGSNIRDKQHLFARPVGQSSVFSKFSQAAGVLSGGGQNVLSNAGSVINQLGSSVAVAGTVFAVAGGALLLGNAMVQAYERVMKGAMGLAGAFDKLTNSSEKNSQIIDETYKDTAELSMKYGKEIEEVYGIREELARQGIRGGINKSLTDEILATALKYGVNAEPLAGLVGLGARFNQGNALSIVERQALAAGMGGARLGEYALSTQQLFEQGLSRGIIRGFSQLTTLQNFFSQNAPEERAELWKGMFGTQRITQMEETIRNAYQLGRNEDVYLYQAAGRLTGYNPLAIREMLESGMTPQLLRSYSNILNEYFGTNQASKLMAIANTFGTTIALSRDILNALEQGDWEKAYDIAKDIDKDVPSKQLEALKSSQQLLVSIAEAGSHILPLRTELTKLLTKGVNLLNDGIEILKKVFNVTAPSGNGETPSLSQVLSDVGALEYPEINTLESNNAAVSTVFNKAKASVKSFFSAPKVQPLDAELGYTTNVEGLQKSVEKLSVKIEEATRVQEGLIKEFSKPVHIRVRE